MDKTDVGIYTRLKKSIASCLAGPEEEC